MKFEVEYVKAVGMNPKDYKLVPLLEYPLVTVWEKASMSQVRIGRKFVATDSVIQYVPPIADFIEPCVMLRRYYPLGNEVAYYSEKAAAASVVNRRVMNLPNRDPAFPTEAPKETPTITPTQLNISMDAEEYFWRELMDMGVCWDDVDNRPHPDDGDNGPIDGLWPLPEECLDFSPDLEIDLGEDE